MRSRGHSGDGRFKGTGQSEAECLLLPEMSHIRGELCRLTHCMASSRCMALIDTEVRIRDVHRRPYIVHRNTTVPLCHSCCVEPKQFLPH